MDAGDSSNTSIFIFQRKESLAGFAERYGRLTEAEFLARHPDPFFLTSMPTELNLAAWSFLIPVSRKLLDVGKESSTKVLVGRSPECDVVLAPKSISRKHAVFDKKPDGWFFTDLGSTNGSKLEGKLINPGIQVAIRSSPVKIELGSDVTLWLLLPDDLYAFASCFAQQLSETSKHHLPAVKVGAEKKDKTPVENSFLAKLPPEPTVAPKPPKEAPERARIAEAETGLFSRYDPGKARSDTEEPTVKLSDEAPKAGVEADEKFDAAIKAITALDSLITTVTVQSKVDGRSMTIFSASDSSSPRTKDRIADVVDRLQQFRPIMQSVVVTLSTGGEPVKIYAAE